MFANLSTSWLILIFVISGIVIWMAGTKISLATDILDSRLKIGDALGGAIFLALASSLPEIAVVVTAAVNHNTDIVIGNILGGIALQTVVLVFIDLFGVKNKSLSYRAASLTIVLEALMVIILLVLTIIFSKVNFGFSVGNASIGSIIIVFVWVAGIWLINKARKDLQWKIGTKDPDVQTKSGLKAEKIRNHKYSTSKAVFIFILASLITLVAGVMIEESGNVIADMVGMNGVIFGATILAAATSISEFSIGLASAKLKDYQLAMSDAFGGNAFLPILFVIADICVGAPVLNSLKNMDIYLTCLAILLTVIYIFGIIFRSKKTFLRIGTDSLIVLIIYIIGIAGLLLVI